MTKVKATPRVVVVASHVVQYNAPWYRALAATADLQVLFAHRITPADHARSGFGVAFEWDIPLLEGYRFDWLRNASRRPGIDHFWGCNTPEIGSVLARARADAVIVTGWNLWTYWQAVRAARRAGIPVMVRGDTQPLTRGGSIRRVAKEVAYPRLLSAFDACLFVGRRNRDYYIHYGVPASRLHSSPHSVDNAFFSRAAGRARRSVPGPREALGIPRDAVVFAFAGKLADFKRPLDVMTAIDLARREGAPAWALIVGDGALGGAIDEHQRRNQTPCTVAGFINQQHIAAAYAAADVLVLPSSAETWGLVVNEAMACGVPAIVSDQVGCAPDLVLEGRTGFTYPCGDTRALAAHIIRLAADEPLRRAMSISAAAHVEAFSPEATAAGVMAALEQLGCLGAGVRGFMGAPPGQIAAEVPSTEAP